MKSYKSCWRLHVGFHKVQCLAPNKFLGVIINRKPCWKPHINNVKTKMSKNIAILHRTKDIFNQKSLYILYYSLTAPDITYCVEIWENTCKTNTISVYLLSGKAVGIVSRSDNFEPIRYLWIYMLLSLLI